MAAKLIYDDVMTRRNIFLPDTQFIKMSKLAKHEHTSVAALYREAAEKLIGERVQFMRLAKKAAELEKAGAS